MAESFKGWINTLKNKSDENKIYKVRIWEMNDRKLATK